MNKYRYSYLVTITVQHKNEILSHYEYKFKTLKLANKFFNDQIAIIGNKGKTILHEFKELKFNKFLNSFIYKHFAIFKEDNIVVTVSLYKTRKICIK